MLKRHAAHRAWLELKYVLVSTCFGRTKAWYGTRRVCMCINTESSGIIATHGNVPVHRDYLIFRIPTQHAGMAYSSRGAFDAIQQPYRRSILQCSLLAAVLITGVYTYMTWMSPMYCLEQYRNESALMTDSFN